MGFGAPTGIDVAGEVAGLVRDPAVQPWQQIDLANGSFGQGIAVTLMQLATAYCAMVNGGTLPTPHVVKATGDTPTTVADRGRVMTPALSADLTAIMERVVNVVPFYRDRTLIPGYLVGGKTGTAQIWDRQGACLQDGRLQLLVRGLHRPDVARARRRRRDQGGQADREPARRPGERGRVVRALPTDRHGCRDDPGHAARPARPVAIGAGVVEPVSAACATLPGVTTEPAPGQGGDSTQPAAAPAMRAADLVASTGGILVRDGGRPVRGGAVDSRAVEPGNLFVALPGERTDGHRFLEAAAAAGAAAVLVEPVARRRRRWGPSGP